MACARHLQNWGAETNVFVTRPSETLAPATFHQLEILHRMQIPISLPGAVPKHEETDLIVDGIIGYSLSGPPKGSAADLIHWANEQGFPILARVIRQEGHCNAGHQVGDRCSLMGTQYRARSAFTPSTASCPKCSPCATGPSSLGWRIRTWRPMPALMPGIQSYSSSEGCASDSGVHQV